MAGTQASNQLLDLLRALKRRRYQVLVPALLVSTFGIAFAVIVPKSYRVSTRIEITDRLRAESDYRLRNPQDTAIRREAGAAFDHIVHFQRVKEVIEASYLLWPEYVALRTEPERQQFIRERILGKNLFAAPTSKDPKDGTIFIDISYSDEDKVRAARFLSDLSESWLREMLESDRTIVTNESEQLQALVDAQAKDLKEKTDRYYQVLALLEKDPSAPEGDGRREDLGDWTFRQLEKAKTNESDVQLKLENARFDLQQAQANLDKTPPEIQKRLPSKADEAAALELQQKKTQLALLEDKIAGLTTLATTYKRLKPEIDKLTEEIQELERAEPEKTERWESAPNPVYAEYEAAVRAKTDEVGRLSKQRDGLQAQIDDLEQKTLARNEHYQHLEELRNEVVEARVRVNETTRKWHDSEQALQMLDSAPQPWRIAQPPVPSTAKTTPNPLLLSAVSVVAGLALGIGLALLSELAKTSYRSVSDLSSVMSVPVIGAIETIVTRRERRRLQLSRAFAALSTAVIVGSIGWITWLWASAPAKLPLELQDVIERLRSALK